MSQCSCPVSHSHVVPGTSKSGYSDHCSNCHSLRNFGNVPYMPHQLLQHIQARQQQPYPPNVARTMGGSQQGSDSSGGTPVYLYGYSQPWDCAHPALRGTLEYDYAQVPVEDAYNYTQPIQDSRLEHVNTLNQGGHRNPQKIHYGVPQGYHGGSEHNYPSRGPYRDKPHIPVGGPPGNYCEGPFRGQIDSLNRFNRTMSEGGTPMPYLEGYKIVPPQNITSEYKVVGGDSPSESGRSSSSGGRHGTLKGQMPIECDTRQFNPSEGLPEGYRRAADSPISEDPDYAEDSENGVDMEHNNERGIMLCCCCCFLRNIGFL